jgi:hypothetical protein
VTTIAEKKSEVPVRAACIAHGWSFGEAGSPAVGGA